MVLIVGQEASHRDSDCKQAGLKGKDHARVVACNEMFAQQWRQYGKFGGAIHAYEGDVASSAHR